jgi:hypothetical protein
VGTLALLEPELEPELPPHDTSVAMAAPHATTPHTASRDFMTALLVQSKGLTDKERGGRGVYSSEEKGLVPRAIVMTELASEKYTAGNECYA